MFLTIILLDIVICLLFIPKNFCSAILRTTNFVWGGTIRKCFQCENFVHAEIVKLHACYAVIYLYVVLLSVHKQTHVYARQALNRSINMCSAIA